MKLLSELKDRGQRLARRGAAQGEPKPPKTAILVVNGFDRRGRWGAFNEVEAKQFPWVELCLSQIERHTCSKSYEVLVWDNSSLPGHHQLIDGHPLVRLFKSTEEPDGELRHGASLDRLVKEVLPGTEFVVTMDTDSFPIRDGWLDNLTARLTDDFLLTGVWRDELLPAKPAFVHPCGLAIRKDTLDRLGVGFTVGNGADVGARITTAVKKEGGRISRLRRSNHWDPHFLMGAIYGDLIYHQGAGSRAAKFSGRSSQENDESQRQALRNAAFSRTDELIAVLAGDTDPGSFPELAEPLSPPSPENVEN